MSDEDAIRHLRDIGGSPERLGLVEGAPTEGWDRPEADRRILEIERARREEHSWHFSRMAAVGTMLAAVATVTALVLTTIEKGKVEEIRDQIEVLQGDVVAVVLRAASASENAQRAADKADEASLIAIRAAALIDGKEMARLFGAAGACAKTGGDCTESVRELVQDIRHVRLASLPDGAPSSYAYALRDVLGQVEPSYTWPVSAQDQRRFDDAWSRFYNRVFVEEHMKRKAQQPS